MDALGRPRLHTRQVKSNHTLTPSEGRPFAPRPSDGIFFPKFGLSAAHAAKTERRVAESDNLPLRLPASTFRCWMSIPRLLVLCSLLAVAFSAPGIPVSRRAWVNERGQSGGCCSPRSLQRGAPARDELRMAQVEASASDQNEAFAEAAAQAGAKASEQAMQQSGLRAGAQAFAGAGVGSDFLIVCTTPPGVGAGRVTVPPRPRAAAMHTRIPRTPQSGCSRPSCRPLGYPQPRHHRRS